MKEIRHAKLKSVPKFQCSLRTNFVSSSLAKIFFVDHLSNLTLLSFEIQPLDLVRLWVAAALGNLVLGLALLDPNHQVMRRV